MDTITPLSQVTPEFYAALVELSPVGVITLDVNQNCIKCNDKWKRLFEPCRVNHWKDCISPEYTSELNEYLESEYSYSLEVRLVSGKWVSFKSKKTKHGYVCTFRCLDKEKMLLDQLFNIKHEIDQS